MAFATPAMPLVVLFVAGVWAGAQNALAGGGGFITLPALMFAGLSPLAANVTSTVAMFPAQVTSGLTGRHQVSGAGGLSFRALLLISLAGGALGGLLLLGTPSRIFARLVPWLVLFATALFAWGSFVRRPPPESRRRMGRMGMAVSQMGIAIYGGYFGGGIGFLMMAALTAVGLAIRKAGATKNALAAAMNLSAVVVFVFSPQLHGLPCVVLAAGGIIGGWLGARALHRVNEQALRVAVLCIGMALSIGLFLRPV